MVQSEFFILLLWASVIGGVVGIVMVVGAVKMMRLKSHGLATLSSLLALLPCGPAWLLGLPMGIWSLVVLNRRHVRDGFQAQAALRAAAGRVDSPANRVIATGRDIVQAPADAMILAAGAAILTAIGVWIWFGVQRNTSLAENTRFTLVSMALTQAVYGLCMAAGGLFIRRLRFRILALLAVVIVGLFVPAVLALNVIMEFKHIPQWPVLIPMWLGVPIAAWTMVVLFRRDVRRAFEEQQRSA